MGNPESFSELLKIMKTLRAPGGCEWDASQTHETLKPYVVEEAFEVIEAIESKDPGQLREELGDLLLQVVFHAILSEENGDFDLYDVTETLNEKLVRRHPHVFGDAKGYSYERWEEIKAKEKGDKKRKLGKINQSIPGLSMARRVQENAAEYGFDWDSAEEVYDKVYEEIEELREASTYEDQIEEIGDLLFAVSNLARHLNIDPEIAVRRSTDKFVMRFEKMNEIAEREGIDFKSQSLRIMEDLWQKAKKGKGEE